MCFYSKTIMYLISSVFWNWRVTELVTEWATDTRYIDKHVLKLTKGLQKVYLHFSHVPVSMTVLCFGLTCIVHASKTAHLVEDWRCRLIT